MNGERVAEVCVASFQLSVKCVCVCVSGRYVVCVSVYCRWVFSNDGHGCGIFFAIFRWKCYRDVNGRGEVIN